MVRRSDVKRGHAFDGPGRRAANGIALGLGTNEEKCSDPKVKPLAGDLARKLKNLPLKFKNYFEVNHQKFTINDKHYTKVQMSEVCYIEVMDKGDPRVTVKLYGEGKFVSRVDKPLPKGETVAIAGNAKDGGAWLVIIQPADL